MFYHFLVPLATRAWDAKRDLGGLLNLFFQSALCLSKSVLKGVATRTRGAVGNTGGDGCCFPYFAPWAPGPGGPPDKRMLTAGMPSFEEYRKSHD